MIYSATMVVSYRGTMVVSDYILLAALLQFHNVANCSAISAQFATALA